MITPRIQQIEEYILEWNMVSLEELCNVFSISMSTLRRDLNELQKKGRIKKIYGGVSRTTEPLLIPFHIRSNVNSADKHTVCKLAAQLIEENDIVFIDTGSTTCNLIDYMQHLHCVTVITNNLDVIIRAIPYSNIHLYTLSGMLNRANNSFSLIASDKVFQNFNIKKAFMAASGLSLNNNVSHDDPLENPIKRAAMDKAEHRYLLLDHSKFGKSSLQNYSHLTDFEYIFTDQCPHEEYVLFCERNGVQLTFPNINTLLDVK